MYETRRKFIFDLLKRNGTVTVAELCRILDVSEMTIRRDIRSMAQENLLRQVHGGAVAIGSPAGAAENDPTAGRLTAFGIDDMEKSFALRSVEELGRKQAIAREASAFLDGLGSLYIDGSTTCGELARLIWPTRELLVVTDSLQALLELHGRPNLELVLLGGVLDRDGNTFDGVLTVDNARKVMVDACFFSAAGFSPEVISNAGMTGSQVKQLMIRHARQCLLLADSTKFGRQGLIRLCDWPDVDVLVTDDGLGSADLEQIRSLGVEVHQAPCAERRP